MPEAAMIAALRAVGTLVVQTITSAAEARLAAAAYADVLAVQASAAGGHSGTLTPQHIPAPVPPRPTCWARCARRSRTDQPVGWHRIPPCHRRARRADPAAAGVPALTPSRPSCGPAADCNSVTDAKQFAPLTEAANNRSSKPSVTDIPSVKAPRTSG
ncbi:nitronate monooxygenase [Saccharopolyspora shandongensis]|uniref:nitronate monooxygenase n=1 Tax=Saccharopolyspora shandongensis TaxID=418495 RepID=UPI00343EEE3C